ncbi:MAG: response regulator transcription factor [Gammaproteobacteria bacterium]|nr:response regulator transcription factor [Gammaproteobacteria bacterium]TVQ48592.1 MAG: DNA-binding response regulator [Gammaproteobacteria bacterium]
MTQPIVFIVDDDHAVRDALRMLIKSVGLPVQVYASGDEFLGAWQPEMRGCIVADIRMPGMSGLEMQEALLDRGCRLPVIFITGHGDVPMAVEAMKAGALDFVQKPFRDQDLLDRINEGLQQEKSLHQVELEIDEITGRLEALTPRERQVLDRVVSGQPNKVIAMDLDVSQRTVEIHRARVMEKMQARSLAQLVQMMSRLENLREG